MLARAPAAVTLWLVLCGIEALLVGKIDPQETPVGVLIAVLAAGCATAGMRASGSAYTLPLAALLAVPRVLWTIVRDTVTVTIALARAASGTAVRDRLERRPIEARGEGPRSATERALAVAGTSAGPNTIVVDVDEERGTMLVHRLA